MTHDLCPKNGDVLLDQSKDHRDTLDHLEVDPSANHARIARLRVRKLVVQRPVGRDVNQCEIGKGVALLQFNLISGQNVHRMASWGEVHELLELVCRRQAFENFIYRRANNDAVAGVKRHGRLTQSVT